MGNNAKHSKFQLKNLLNTAGSQNENSNSHKPSNNHNNNSRNNINGLNISGMLQVNLNEEKRKKELENSQHNKNNLMN